MTTKAYTIADFCTAYRIPRSTYYELRHEGRGPATYKIGTRVFISAAAAEEWARQQEATSETRATRDITAGKRAKGPRSAAAAKTVQEAPKAQRRKPQIVGVLKKPAAPQPASRRAGRGGDRPAGTASGRSNAKTLPNRQPQRR